MKKLLFGLAIAAALLVILTGTVFAQEATPPLTGMVQSITLETDSTTGETSVVVALVDDLGVVQTIRISLETAIAMNLVAPDPTVVTYVVVDAAVGTTVTLESTEILEEITAVDETPHPVASALSDFFSTLLGVDYDTVMAAHQGDEDTPGMGFGVIAQALWMTKTLEGNTEMFQAILTAKTSGDYSSVVLPDGSTPTNWGQFRKAVLSDKKAAKNNLGSIMSGHAEDDPTTDAASDSTRPDKGNNGNKHNNNKNKGNGKDH
jgi:hypothetical protein